MNDVPSLVQSIQQGHDDFLPELWESIRGLAAWAANQFFSAHRELCTSRGLECEDLVQEGYFAMLAALRQYDPEKGGFSTYLLKWLRSCFQSAIGRTERQRGDLLNRCRSLEELIDSTDPDGDSLLDTIPDPHDDTGDLIDRIYNDGLHEALEAALATIPQGEADIIRAAYWEGKDLTTIAEKTGATFGEIRNTQAKALRHLRKWPARAEIEKYIDDRTPFYQYSSLHHFKQHGERGVEMLVINREGMRRKISRETEVTP